VCFIWNTLDRKLFLKNQGNFNPPGAPHFGGVHEIMVKDAKKAIHAVLSSSEVTDD